MAEELGDDLDEAKVREAMMAERERKNAVQESDRKRKFNSMKSDEVTAEEMEAYHRSKVAGLASLRPWCSIDVTCYQIVCLLTQARAEDPMAGLQ